MQQVLIAPQEIKNYFKSIADHKDVAKTVMMLSSAVNSFRSDIAHALQMYSKYHFLWEQDRDEVVKEFLGNDPILSEFKAVIVKFADLIEEVDCLDDSVIVGAIELLTSE